MLELRHLVKQWDHRPLLSDVSLQVAAGETVTGTRGFKPLLDARALDVAIVDIGWVGGITEAVKVAALEKRLWDAADQFRAEGIGQHHDYRQGKNILANG